MLWNKLQTIEEEEKEEEESYTWGCVLKAAQVAQEVLPRKH